MIWECDDCGYGKIEYACFGAGSQVDHGCSKCGHKMIWFHHVACMDTPADRWLVDVRDNTVLKKEILEKHFTNML